MVCSENIRGFPAVTEGTATGRNYDGLETVRGSPVCIDAISTPYRPVWGRLRAWPRAGLLDCVRAPGRDLWKTTLTLPQRTVARDMDA